MPTVAEPTPTSPQVQAHSATKKPSVLRKLVQLGLIVVAIPLAILLAAEGLVRLFGSSSSSDPYLAFSTAFSILAETEVDGRPHYQITQAYRSENKVFSIHKDPDTLRVFCLGGSAAAGWPHPANQDYPAYLQQLLERAWPERRIEVHNVAGHGYASYRVRAVFDQIIECDPDLVIVYSGNNEFVEDRSYVADAGVTSMLQTIASRSQLVRVLLSKISLSGDRLDGLAVHLALHVRGLSNRLRNSDAQLEVLTEHFGYSMRQMAREAAKRGLPMLYLTVPCNLRDWRPNASMVKIGGAAKERWQDGYDAGRRAILEGDYVAAVEQLERAVTIHSDHSDTHFHLGKAYDGMGRFDQAKTAYRASKDTDGNPFRVLSRFNRLLRSLPAEFPGVGVIDAEALFDDAARDRVPGNDLFLDYVHPTKTGNLILARAVSNWIVTQSSLAPADGEVRQRRAILEYEDDGYVDDDDVLLQWTLITLSGMMHQYVGFLDRGRTLFRRLDAGEITGDLIPPKDLFEKFEARFVAHLDALHNELLGKPFDPDYEKQLSAFYQDLLPDLFEVDLGQ